MTSGRFTYQLYSKPERFFQHLPLSLHYEPFHSYLDTLLCGHHVFTFAGGTCTAVHSFLFFPQQPDWFFKKINQVTSQPAQNSSLNSHLWHRVHILPTADKVIDDLNPADLSSHSGLSVSQTYKIYFLPQSLCAYRFCPTPPILFTSWFHGFLLLHLDHCSNVFSPRIIPTTCLKDLPFPPISGRLTWFASLDHVQVWIGGGFSCCSTVLIVHHIVTLTVTSHW